MQRTATTSNAILGLLTLRPAWSTWEIRNQLLRNMRFFWPRAESRIYEEARRLVERGLATGEKTFVGRRQRTTYKITPAGRCAVGAWLEAPPRATHLECEPLLRILLADLCTQQQLQAAVDQVKADSEAILSIGRTVGREYLEGAAPFQDQIHARALVFNFLSHHARMLRDWAERAEETIAAWPELSAAERAERAAASVAADLAAFPPPLGSPL